MTTIEKLFVQIFERKSHIIEQVKQQTDLYSQHLASKLLIDGITPPPWLWNPNFNSESSDPKEFKKEDLISELLLPHPRPAVLYSSDHCSLYNKPGVIGHNGECSDGLVVETHAFDQGCNARHMPTSSLECHDNDIGCALNCVPELDLSANSPQEQNDVRISNTSSDRPKTMVKCDDNVIGSILNLVPELDISATSPQGQTEVRISDIYTTVLQSCDNDNVSASDCVPELDLSATSPQGQTEVKIPYICTAPDQSLARIQRSKSRQKAIELRKSAKAAAAARSRLTDENATGVCSSGIDTSRIASKRLDHDEGLFGLAKYSDTVNDDPAVRHAGESIEKNANTYSGRFTRSRISCNQYSHDGRYMKPGKSSGIAKKEDCSMIRSQRTCVEQLSKPVSLSYSSSLRVTRSKSGASKICPLDNLLNRSERFHVHNVLAGEVIRHCPDSNAVVSQEGKENYITESKLISDGLVEAQAACSKSNLDAGEQSVGSLSLSYAASQRVTRFKSGASKKSPLDNLLNRSERFHLQNVSGGEVIRHCPDSNAVVSEEEKRDYVTGAGLISDGLIEAQAACSKSKLDAGRRGAGSLSLSYTASQRVTRSKSGASIKSPLDNLPNRSGRFHLHNVSGAEEIQDCPDSNATVSQEGKDNRITETELISDGPVEAQAACSESDLDAGGQSVGFEASASRLPFDCSVFLKPKTLDFGGMENSSLNKIYSPLLGKERLDEASAERCTPVESAATQQEITLHNRTRRSLEKQPQEQEVSNKNTDAWRGSFETCAEDCAVADNEVPKSKLNENLKNAEDKSVAVQDIRHSPVSHGTDVARPSVGKGLVEIHPNVKCNWMEGLESSPELQVEVCEVGSDRRDRSEATPSSSKHQQLGPSFVSSLSQQSTVDQGCLVGEVGVTDPSSSVHDSRQCHVEDNQDLMCRETKDGMAMACGEGTLLEKKSDRGEDCFLACGSVGSLDREENCLGSSRMVELPVLEESLLPGRRLRPATENSWPQFKWKKTESQQTNIFSVSPSCRAKKIGSIGVRDILGTDLQFHSITVSREKDVAQSNSGRSPDIEMHWKVNYHLTQGTEPSRELRLEQGELGFQEGNPGTNIPSTLNLGQYGPYVLSTLTNDATGDFQDCSVKNGETTDTASIVLDERIQADEKNNKSMLPMENNVSMENKDDLSHTERILQETESSFEEDGLFSLVSPKYKHLDYIDETLPELEGFIIGGEENGQPPVVGDAISLDNFDLPSTTIERASVLEQLCRSASMHTPLSNFSTKFKLHRTPDLYQSVPNGLLEHVNLKNTLNLSDGSKRLRASYNYMDEVNRAFQGFSHSDGVPYSDPHYDWSTKNPPTSPIPKLWDRISSNSSGSKKQQSINPELTCFPIEEDPSISEENESADEVATIIQEGIYSTLMNCGAKREPLAELTEAHINVPTSVSAAERFPDRSSLESVNTEVNFTGTHCEVRQKLGKHNSNKRRCTNETKENRALSVTTNCLKKASTSFNNRFSKPQLLGKTSLRKGGQGLSEREPKHNNIVSNITSFLPLVQQKQAAAVGAGKRDIKVKALEAAEAAKRLEEKRENDRKMKKEALKLERARIEKENMRQMELMMKMQGEEQKKKDAEMAARKRVREEEEQKDKERKRTRIGEVRRQLREQKDKLRTGKVEKEVPLSAIPTSALTKATENDELEAKTSREKSYDISPYQCSDDEDDEEDEDPNRKYIPSWASKNCVALVLSSQQNVDAEIIFPPESFCSLDEENRLHSCTVDRIICGCVLGLQEHCYDNLARSTAPRKDLYGPYSKDSRA